MVGLTVSLLACPMAMKARLYNWFPPNLRVQIISGSRTLLLFTLLATLGAGFVGGGGFGFYLMEQVNLLEYGNIVEGFLLLGAMALIFDLILGIVEYRATF